MVTLNIDNPYFEQMFGQIYVDGIKSNATG